MFFEGSANIYWRNLENPAAEGVLVGQIVNTTGGIEQLFSPVSYETSDGRERVLFSLGHNNPVLMSVRVDESGGSISTVLNGGDYGDFTTSPSSSSQNMFVDIDGGGGSAGSEDMDDCYPNISSDSRWLILNRTDEGAGVDDPEQTTMFILQNEFGNFMGGAPGTTRQMSGPTRRAIWVP